MSTGDTAWREAVEAHRDRKDDYFASDPHSPVPAAEREGFDGLDYFPPDPDYRFVVELREHDSKRIIAVATTSEGEREYVEWGEFRFEIDGEEYSLQAYKSDEHDPGFWVPFRDRTSGEETYGAGRYIDLDPGEDRTDDGRWVLDFNYAYSPFCAYSERYECPLVPMENWLEARIEAGELTYRGA